MAQIVAKYPEKIKDWAAVRRELHQHPEISGQEKNTARIISRYLEMFLPERMTRGIGKTGILALFHGNEPGPTTWFRAELDALPIEETDRPYSSQKPGVAHLCGHDGHMTVLLALAQLLYQKPVPKGRIGLLFQPAEETGAGAERMIKSTKLKKLFPDQIFAVHNLPGYPKDTIIIKDGNFTSAVVSLAMRFKGHTAHAAEPDKAVNPGQIILDLWKKAQQLTVLDPGSEKYAIITPVHFRLGSKDYGITPGNGELHLTIRTHTDDRLRKIIDQLTRLAERKADSEGIKFEVDTLQHFPAVINDESCVKMIRSVAEKNKIKTIEKDMPFTWGEDFSRYLNKSRGALIGWGAGENCAPLHHPDYDFPDDQINKVAQFFYNLAMRYHG